jgi:hypothetical protein
VHDALSETLPEKERPMNRTSFYHVLILTETGWTVSRLFEKLSAARKYAKWCSERWEAKIYKGGPGGELVA